MNCKSIINAVAVAVVAAVFCIGCVVEPYNYTSTVRTVTIGGKVWMAENLNRATASSKCYGNDTSNCAKYGRLYNWADAKSACPSGFHLPSNDEWAALVDYAGGVSTAGTKLKATSGWYNNGNGTDDYGWSALPGGRGNSGGDFDSGVFSGYWWSATEGDGDTRCKFMNYNDEYVYWNGDFKTYFCSVRCVQN